MQEFRGDKGIVHVAELALDEFEFAELGSIGVVELEAISELFGGDTEGVELFDFAGLGGLSTG